MRNLRLVKEKKVSKEEAAWNAATDRFLDILFDDLGDLGLTPEEATVVWGIGLSAFVDITKMLESSKKQKRKR